MNINRAAVRDARYQRGWSQEQLAAAAAVSPSTVARIESGDTSAAWPVTMRKLADALGCDVADLIARDDESETIGNPARVYPLTDTFRRSPHDPPTTP